jgi:hypothetical protein
VIVTLTPLPLPTVFSKLDGLPRSLAPLLPAPRLTTTIKLSPKVTYLKLFGEGIPDEASEDRRQQHLRHDEPNDKLN